MKGTSVKLLGRAQLVIPLNLYSNVKLNEHNSLGSPGKEQDAV